MKHSMKQRGVGLIEVLITLLILSTSLITLTTLQNKSVQFNQMAYFRTQANIMAYDILDRIRVNKRDLPSYTVALGAFDGASQPANTNIAATDLYEWRRQIDAELPSGQGGITCTAATGECEITIVWDEINSSDVDDDAEATSKFMYMVKI